MDANDTNAAQDRLIKANEACIRLSITRVTLDKLITQGAIRRVKIGRAVRIPESEIIRFIRDERTG